MLSLPNCFCNISSCWLSVIFPCLQICIQCAKFSGNKCFLRVVQIKFIRLKECSTNAVDSGITAANLIIWPMSLCCSKCPASCHLHHKTWFWSHTLFHSLNVLADLFRVSIASHVLRLSIWKPNFPVSAVILCSIDWPQLQAYEKQGHATITLLVTKFRGYRCVKSCTPTTK